MKKKNNNYSSHFHQLIVACLFVMNLHTTAAEASERERSLAGKLFSDDHNNDDLRHQTHPNLNIMKIIESNQSGPVMFDEDKNFILC